MRSLSLVVGALAAAAFVAAPAQAAPAQSLCGSHPIGLRCIPGDPFRPCGPIVICP